MDLQVDVQSLDGSMVEVRAPGARAAPGRRQISGRVQRPQLRMVVEAEAQRDEDHREQRAAVAVGAGLVVVRHFTAVLFTAAQFQV